MDLFSTGQHLIQIRRICVEGARPLGNDSCTLGGIVEMTGLRVRRQRGICAEVLETSQTDLKERDLGLAKVERLISDPHGIPCVEPGLKGQVGQVSVARSRQIHCHSQLFLVFVQ